MRILVTGSSGHLGEALVRTLQRFNHELIGVDLLDSPFTTCVGSIADRALVRSCMPGVQVVFHTASPLARLVGSKGYHAEVFADGPYPTLRE
jgi:nucleoside-diphosphate-sugar epimerase